MNHRVGLTSCFSWRTSVGIAPLVLAGQAPAQPPFDGGPAGRPQVGLDSAVRNGISHRSPRVWCCCSIPEARRPYGPSLHGDGRPEPS